MCHFSTFLSVSFIKSKVRPSIFWRKSKCSVVTTLSLWLASFNSTPLLVFSLRSPMHYPLSSLLNINLCLPLTHLMFSNPRKVITQNLAPFFQMQQTLFGHILETKGTPLVNSNFICTLKSGVSRIIFSAAQKLLESPWK